MAKRRGTNPIGSFKGTTIDLAKFNLKNEKEQYSIIEKTLKDIYEDNLDVTRKHVMKVIRLTLNTKDDYIYLPYDLKVEKEKLDLNFYIEKRRIGIGWILFGLWLLLFAIIGATYSGIRYINMASLNKDIDNDGIPDINIDINNDGKAEINIDNNNDNKPNLNVDYKGNRRAVFNLDLDGDGKPDSNLVVDASNPDKLKECTLNCDTNDDGWPDLNIDLDGDGKADVDIDTDGDGVADLNIDLDGDGVCDVMCDTNNDGTCDKNCINPGNSGIKNGSSTSTGNPDAGSGSTVLILRFVEGETVNVENLVPDDQPLSPNEVIPKGYKTFTVENLSDYSLTYSLKMKVIYNTFISNNFQYRITGTNGGTTFGYRVAPKKDEYIAERIVIPARATQKYTIEFNLFGIGAPQNEDQNRIFRAQVEIES